MPRQPKIVVLAGLPGSGKSTWLRNRKLPALSSDAMRVLLSGDVTNQKIHGKVFAALRYLLRERIKLRCPLTYVDATHLTPKERKPYLDIGKKYGCRVEALLFDTPLEECLRRNRTRERVVPDCAIQRMAAKLVKPSKKEGFSKVVVVTFP
ncbi:MAG: AAA family ATPase [Acidobacteriia bacterium]|nr:AAA family ATPase [Terriglobia bacterium]